MFNLFKSKTKAEPIGQAEEGLLIIPVPSLVSSLFALDSAKGSPLSEDEVWEATDKAPCIVMPAHAAEAVALERGYDDIDPENAWAEWQAIRPSFYGNGEL